MDRRRGVGGGLSKLDAFWESIKTENLKTLQWSLAHGGFSLTKPFHEETQLPPIHYCVLGKKLKSLKCMLDQLDRMRDFAVFLDFKGGQHEQTPLMMACSIGWTEGVWELLRFDASLTATDNKGMTARQIAEKQKKHEVVAMIDDFLRPDDEPVVETYAMQQKRQDIEATRARREEEARKEEEAGIAAKEQKFLEKDRLEAAQTDAAALAKWDEVKVALAELSAELKVAREDEGEGEPSAPDPTLWQCETLKILRLRMGKGRLVQLPPDLGRLVNLTELIVGHNSLVTFPPEIKHLVNLKALEAEANCLESLPVEIGECVNLEVVNVTANKLTSLAPLAPLKGILSLLASQNQLTDLEFEIETKERMIVLAVSDNQLTALPAGIGALQMLKELNAANNQLTELPTEMGQLSEKKLQILKLEGNKFTDRKVKSILEKSVKPVKELTNHLRNQGDGGGGGGGKKKGGKKKK
eukprot:m.177366 g.177366  ORF g.177366 m.177366 type:complete len:469 (+) comp14332_c0_seq1:2-1408(+)